MIAAASNTPENANKAKFLGDLSEIQQAVSVKRSENLIPSINNIDTDLNAGFTKVKIKKEEIGQFEDGWVVNLEEIKVKNSTLGQAYGSVTENSEIVFGANAPDVYVYDANGEVYYSRGHRDGKNTIFSQSLMRIEPENPNDWEFDPITGTITRYIGNAEGTLVIPNYINGHKVNSIIGSEEEGGITFGKNIANIQISTGISSIGEYAFNCCYELESIVIPNSVISIGPWAFVLCTSLTSITIPSGITNIAEGVFCDCDALTNITIPNGVTSIGDYAFFDCDALVRVDLPNGLISIGEYAFFECDELTYLTIPATVTTIGEDAFEYCPKLNGI